MPASAPTILATSMGFVSRGRGPYDWAPGPIFDLAFELADAPQRPQLCYLGTVAGTSGDSTLKYLWEASGLIILGACIGSLSALVQGVFQPAMVKVATISRCCCRPPRPSEWTAATNLLDIRTLGACRRSGRG